MSAAVDLSAAMADLGHQLGRRTSYEFVRDTLRRAIVSGLLPSGARLVQTDVAKQLGVSTTPVREALRDLAGEGLIQLDAHRGGTVRHFRLEELEEVYELRKLLEPYGMRLAVERITATELARARGLHEQMDGGVDVGDWVQLNRAFHAVLTDAARSPRLTEILRGLRDLAQIYVGLGMQTVGDMSEQERLGNREHGQILRAFEKKRPDDAAAVIVTHLQSTMDLVRQHFEAVSA